jgi:acetyl esterase
MPLHPQATALLAALADAPPLDLSAMTAEEFRKTFTPPEGNGAVAVARVLDLTVDAGDHGIPVRIYYPVRRRSLPVTLYMHGGGFVIGDIGMTDAICRSLALSSGGAVVSVGYRLAPEAPFPQGLEDCATALAWLHKNADEIGVRADRIAVAGDSSGANFAAVLAQRSRHLGPRLCHQLLFYPPLDTGCDTPSYLEYADGYLLTSELMRWYWSQYLPGDAQRVDVRAAPARQSDLRGVPAATIHVAEYDVLRSEAEQYAADLAAAGIDVRLTQWPGQIHGFLLQQGANPDSDRALAEAGASLRAAFAEA